MSVSHSPVNEFSHIPLILDNRVRLYQMSLKPVDDSEKLVVFHDFTLLDVLDAIFDDISFLRAGERESFLDGMRERIEGVKELYNVR